jgi:WD40 repeat protein
MRVTPTLAACGLFIAAVLAALPSRAADRFTALDVFQLEYASDPQISPDGRRVVYVRRTNDIMSDTTRSNLWIVDSDGGDHRPLLSGRNNYSSPRWSPDGTRIAYVSGAEGSPQLYVRWMDTGQTALITNLQQAPQSIAWSPDGQQIAFDMLVPSNTEPLAQPPQKPDGAEWAKPVTVIDRVYYRADGQGYLEPGFNHVFIVPATGGTPRQLTEGDYNHGGPLSFTPDGEQLVFSANREEDWELEPRESEVFSLELASGELTRLTDREGPDGSPVVSPDGRRIAYIGFDEQRRGYENAMLYVMNLDGSERRVLTADLDRSVGDPRWHGNGNGVFVSLDDLGMRRIAFVDLSGRVSKYDHVVSGESPGRPYTSGSFSVAGNGSYAYTAGSAARPADVAVARSGRSARTLTALNEDLLGNRDLDVALRHLCEQPRLPVTAPELQPYGPSARVWHHRYAHRALQPAHLYGPYRAGVAPVQAVGDTQQRGQPPHAAPHAPVERPEFHVTTTRFRPAMVPGHQRNHHLLVGPHPEQFRVRDQVVRVLVVAQVADVVPHVVKQRGVGEDAPVRGIAPDPLP